MEIVVVSLFAALAIFGTALAVGAYEGTRAHFDRRLAELRKKAAEKGIKL